MGGVAAALDAYVAAIERTVGRPVPGLGPPPDVSDVRSMLGSLVGAPHDDLIDFWTWRSFADDSCVALFNGAPEPLSLAWLSDATSSLRENMHETESFLPGDSRYRGLMDIDSAVPLTAGAMGGIAVDSGGGPTRGRVFNYALHGASDVSWLVEMFDCLADAVDAARYCIEVGHWIPHLDADWFWIEAPGRVMNVTAADITWPPFGQPPS